MAPFWTVTPRFDDESSMSRVRCDEYNEPESMNGSEDILQDVANFIKKLKPDIMPFNPTWMLVCEWNIINLKISSQVD